MRILVVCPLVINYQNLGADQHSALATLKYLKDLGHEIKIVTMNNTYAPLEEAVAFYAERDLEALVLPYYWKRFALQRLSNPAYLDGAAWEFGSPYFLKAVQALVDDFRPEVCWVRTSSLWPAARL